MPFFVFSSSFPYPNGISKKGNLRTFLKKEEDNAS
jgi:hypothetical protein